MNMEIFESQFMDCTARGLRLLASKIIPEPNCFILQRHIGLDSILGIAVFYNDDIITRLDDKYYPLPIIPCWVGETEWNYTKTFYDGFMEKIDECVELKRWLL